MKGHYVTGLQPHLDTNILIWGCFKSSLPNEAPKGLCKNFCLKKKRRKFLLNSRFHSTKIVTWSWWLCVLFFPKPMKILPVCWPVSLVFKNVKRFLFLDILSLSLNKSSTSKDCRWFDPTWLILIEDSRAHSHSPWGACPSLMQGSPETFGRCLCYKDYNFLDSYSLVTNLPSLKIVSYAPLGFILLNTSWSSRKHI